MASLTEATLTAEKKRILREVLESDNVAIMAQLLEEAGKSAFQAPQTLSSITDSIENARNRLLGRRGRL